ncbi:MAG TPA: hypothetical protein VIL52_05560 [Bacteroidota bacterium]
MKNDVRECRHACRNTCELLNEVLHRETALLQFYEQIAQQCDYPDIRNFIQDVVEERRKPIEQIVSKLNEMRAKSQIMDGVISSFEH